METKKRRVHLYLEPEIRKLLDEIYTTFITAGNKVTYSSIIEMAIVQFHRGMQGKEAKELLENYKNG